jgi:hypothetical protein
MLRDVVTPPLQVVAVIPTVWPVSIARLVLKEK